LEVGQGEPAAAAQRLRRRPPQVRQAVSAAVDEWLEVATDPRYQVSEPHLDWLQALADESDEAWTKEIRAASREKDTGKRRAALEKLATAADVDNLPAPALTQLSFPLLGVGSADAAVRVLHRARQRHPDDFWVNHYLGVALQVAEPQRWEGPVRHLSVAAALRPTSAGAHYNLGNALLRGEQYDEAIACYEKAIALDPKYALAHVNLG